MSRPLKGWIYRTVHGPDWMVVAYTQKKAIELLNDAPSSSRIGFISYGEFKGWASHANEKMYADITEEGLYEIEKRL